MTRGRLQKALCVCAAGALLTLAGCAGARSESGSPSVDGYPSRPERSTQGREAEHFDNLPAMAAASDVVMRAKVADVAVGKTYGDSKEDQFTTRYVTLKPVEVLRGDVPGGSLIYEEAGWDADRTGYVMNGVLWSEPGDEGWYFLHLRHDMGTYRLIVSHGRFALDAAVQGPSGHNPRDDGPWASLPGAVLDSPTEIGRAIRTEVLELTSQRTTATIGPAQRATAARWSGSRARSTGGGALRLRLGDHSVRTCRASPRRTAKAGVRTAEATYLAANLRNKPAASAPAAASSDDEI
jgi:hypothetical protein